MSGRITFDRMLWMLSDNFNLCSALLLAVFGNSTSGGITWDRFSIDQKNSLYRVRFLFTKNPGLIWVELVREIEEFHWTMGGGVLPIL